jgi:hypothetical protein
MIIRNEQMAVFEQTAEESFERRLAAHLREDYLTAVVRLPEMESTVSDLPDETLKLLVSVSIERARSYELTFESSISAFCAIMFEVAPNFDKHSLSKLCLRDENIEPNERLNELIKVLQEEHWEKIRADYDVNAWQPNEAGAEDSMQSQPEAGFESDFAKTVMNIEKTGQTDNPATAKEVDFAQTVINPINTKESAKLLPDDDLNFLDTVLNIDVEKE